MRPFLTRVLLSALAVCALPARAFNPPVDSRDGVTLSLEGVPEQVPTDAPLVFDVALTNAGAHPVRGTVTVALNDDWELREGASSDVALAPGQGWRRTCAAAAKPRVLAALYPVHARFAGIAEGLHPIAVFAAKTPVTAAQAAPAEAVPLAEGLTPLLRLTPHLRAWARNGETHPLPYGFVGAVSSSGATFHPDDIVRGETQRRSLSIHPPWKGGAGTLWSDYRLSLPAATPIRLTFHTAMRDLRRGEPPSDGVAFRVEVQAGEGLATNLFERHVTATVWESAEVDLSAFAGQTLTLRLWNGPGPKNDTTCDNGFWGSPEIRIGTPPPPISESVWAARLDEALRLARAAAAGAPLADGVFRLETESGSVGAALLPGTEGLTDAAIAFSDGTRDVAFRGFTVEVDGQPLGGGGGGQPVLAAAGRSGRRWTLDHIIGGAAPDGRARTARASLWAERGTLRLAWELPGAVRTPRGEPRFTRLALGPATRPVHRIYLGFGAVFEEPGAFTLAYNGVLLGTRHIGADYAGGLSLVQATDLLPDRLVCAPAQNLFALETPHDACFTFAPSSAGAYAAARGYRQVCGFEKSPGVDGLLGRVCLDQWGGDYRQAAADLDRAAAYGLNHALFVKHDWQRWGYDYRLPEIYPPAGGLAPFREMRDAARRAGMLFAPHDNYIDFYPDAAGFSYDHIVFHADGTPHKAWFHPDRQAQSYRWRPDAFTPWLTDNMRQMRQGFAPDALFIDVFTSIAPFDYYDRGGAFHTRAKTAAGWRAAFDTSRRLLGHGAAMLSESGHDALIGSIDGVQADHWRPECWLKTFKDADRTPWHDMVTHGKMVLFAGGLGPRYDPDPKHGYGSDDYLSNTVLGGRGPLCDGPFSRRAVMTYWLLHDACDALARAEMTSHAFGPTVRQQHTVFGQDAFVWVNRGSNVWLAAGQELPAYGFYVKTPKAEAGVVRLGGRRAAFARSEGLYFADARPKPDGEARCAAETRVVAAERLGPRSFRVTFEWDMLAPLEPGHVPFVHVGRLPENEGDGERIEAQAGMALDPANLTREGTFRSSADVTLPADAPAGDYFVRYGLYHAKRGDRVPLRGLEAQKRRLCGGVLRVTPAAADYLLEEPRADDPNLNVAGAMVDFGPLATDGAFRLQHRGRDAWELVPLPASRPLRAELRLAALGAKRRTVRAVERIDPFHAAAREAVWRQDGDTLHLSCDAASFGYRIVFR
jgi:hypothetical protein